MPFEGTIGKLSQTIPPRRNLKARLKQFRQDIGLIAADQNLQRRFEATDLLPKSQSTFNCSGVSSWLAGLAGPVFLPFDPFLKSVPCC